MQIIQKSIFKKITLEFNDDGINVIDVQVNRKIEINVGYENIDSSPSLEKDTPLVLLIITVIVFICSVSTLIGHYTGNKEIAGDAWIFWAIVTFIFIVISALRTKNIISYKNSDGSAFVLLNSGKNSKLSKNIRLIIQENKKNKLKRMYAEKFLTETMDHYKDRLRILVNDNVLNDSEVNDLLTKYNEEKST